VRIITMTSSSPSADASKQQRAEASNSTGRYSVELPPELFFSFPVVISYLQPAAAQAMAAV
jgi:hypothetical protein